MRLDGSCHCGAVRFSVTSRHPYPYNLCYCSICRKTAGSGGFAINIAAEAASLKIEGEAHLRRYHPHMGDGTTSPGERVFCGICGSQLWVWDPRWPELVHPQAGAIDTPLPAPPERTHLMLGSKAPWVAPACTAQDKQFDRYPDESIAQWHERQGLTE